LNSVGGKRLVLKALQAPPYYLLISVELRCFDRCKINYNSETARALDLDRPIASKSAERFCHILSCAGNGQTDSSSILIFLIHPYSLLSTKSYSALCGNREAGHVVPSFAKPAKLGAALYGSMVAQAKFIAEPAPTISALLD
jgi:hypothetical protein